MVIIDNEAETPAVTSFIWRLYRALCQPQPLTANATARVYFFLWYSLALLTEIMSQQIIYLVYKLQHGGEVQYEIDLDDIWM